MAKQRERTRGKWPARARLTFNLAGVLPVAKGSMKGFVPAWKPGQQTRPMAVVSDSKSSELKALAKDIRMIVDVEMTRLALPTAVEQPFEVLLVYYMPRAGGDYFKGTSTVRPQARQTPWTKPDLDKLERATLDALTGLAWDDDSRVVRVVKEKRFATPQRDVGIWCELRVLPATVREFHAWPAETQKG